MASITPPEQVTVDTGHLHVIVQAVHPLPTKDTAEGGQ